MDLSSILADDGESHPGTTKSEQSNFEVMVRTCVVVWAWECYWILVSYVVWFLGISNINIRILIESIGIEILGFILQARHFVSELQYFADIASCCLYWTL